MFLLYWKQIAVVGLLALLFGIGYYEGYSKEKKAYDTFKLQTEVLGKQQQEQTKVLIKKQQQISENITKEYADAVKKINAYYASHPNIKWVHINSTTDNLPSVSETPSTIDGTSERNILNDCALDVLKLQTLQEWVKQNILIGE